MNRKMRSLASFAVVLVVGISGALTLSADQPGFKRVEIERHDLGNPSYEAVLARGELNAGAVTPKHTHPGEEVGYVLEGQVVLEVEGKPPATLHAGDAFFIPAKTAHFAKNASGQPAKILSTYILEKGKPLATPVP